MSQTAAALAPVLAGIPVLRLERFNKAENTLIGVTKSAEAVMRDLVFGRIPSGQLLLMFTSTSFCKNIANAITGDQFPDSSSIYPLPPDGFVLLILRHQMMSSLCKS